MWGHVSQNISLSLSGACLCCSLFCIAPAQTELLCRAGCATGSREASHFQVTYVVDAQLSPQPSWDATSPSAGSKVSHQPEGSWHCLWTLICFWTRTLTHTWPCFLLLLYWLSSPSCCITWWAGTLDKGVRYSDDKNWFPISCRMTLSSLVTQAI